MSDEDYPNPKILRDAIDTLDEFPHVGLIRGSIGTVEGMKPRNGITYSDQFLEAGRSALSMFSLTTNYISGVIYNTRMITSRDILRKFEFGLLNEPVLSIYPHMYLDILIAASCAVITSSETVCMEGEEYNFTMPDLKSMAQNVAYTWGGRMEQFIGFRDAFREVCGFDELDDLSLLIELYLHLISRYYHLCRLDGFLYTARGLNLDALRRSLANFVQAASEIHEFASARDMIRVLISERFQKLMVAYGDRP